MKAKFRDLNHPRRAAELGTDLCFNATSDIVVSQKVCQPPNDQRCLCQVRLPLHMIA